MSPPPYGPRRRSCTSSGQPRGRTVQPVPEVAALCRERGVLLHVDAAQANGHVPIDFQEISCDLLSVSAHKFGGPPGVGALLVRRGLRLRPLLVGGDQEQARRAGYENVPAIVGFGVAAETLGDGRLDAEAADHRALTDAVLAAAPELDGVTAYGSLEHRLPHLVCFGIDGIEPQAVLLGLDQAGVAAHSGSACSSESPSHRRCWRPWVWTPTARCGSRSAGRPSRPMWTRSWTPFPTSSTGLRLRAG